jgi:peptide/nickel transport system ATP-binding protein
VFISEKLPSFLNLTALLKVEGINKNFIINKSFWQSRKQIQGWQQQQEERYLKAVDNVSFELERGKVLVIAGQSGSGKTTLAKLIMGAIRPDKGSIFFNGQTVSNLTGRELKHFRSQVHMVYQDPYASLDPRMRVSDIVMEPLNIHDKKSSKQQKIGKVFEALEEVRLEPKEIIANEFPHELSGGQRQRVALARAIVLKPKLIVADEPVSMLDVSVRAEILELIMNLKERFQISFIYITHDLSTARYIGDNIIIMYKGQVVEEGPIDDVLLKPLHPYTQALIRAIPDPDRILILGGNDSGDSDDHSKEMKVVEISIDGESHSTLEGCKYYNRCPFSMEVCRKAPSRVKVTDTHYASCFLYENRRDNFGSLKG